MKRKLVTVLLGLGLVFSLTACGGSAETTASVAEGAAAEEQTESEAEEPAKERETLHLSLGTSSVGGTYYVWGGGWANIMNNNVAGSDISVEVTGGPQTNLELMKQDEMELALLTTWQAGQGWNGEDWAEGEEYHEARALFPMYASNLYIVTLQGSGIESVDDLEGKRVGVGPAGGASNQASRDVLEFLGIEPASIDPLSADEEKNGLKDGTLDAIFFTNGNPSAVVLDLETTHDLKFLEYSEEEEARIEANFPYWSIGTIKAGTYKNQEEDIQAVSLWNVAAADSELDEEFVYELTKATYEHHDELVAVDQSAAECIPENIIYSTIPLHAGAYRYYQEIGVEIPDALKPIDE